LRSFDSDSYFSYSRYLKQRFKKKVHKIPISSGLTCPTRDGSLGSDGCGFCDETGSSSFYGYKTKLKTESIKAQLESQIPETIKRFGVNSFFAYFQSYSNTYAPLEILREIYEAALAVPNIEGICIGTRPDCLNVETLRYLESLASARYVSIELGVQSFNEATLIFFERRHTVKTTIDCLELIKTHAPHVDVCLHLILGAPTDGPDVAVDSAKMVNHHMVNGVKLHQLMVLDGTRLADKWKQENFRTVAMEDYAKMLLGFLEHLEPSVYIERLFAIATKPEKCLAPDWSKVRWAPYNFLLQYLRSSNCKQGSKITLNRSCF